MCSPSPTHQPTAGHVLVHLLPCGLFRLSEVGRHFHRSSQNRPEPTPTSAAHSLNPSNDRPITQRLTPPLHPLPFEVWSLPLVTLSGRYCGLGTALQVSPPPPPDPPPPQLLSSGCTGVPGQPGPLSVPTRLQPLTAPTQKSASCRTLARALLRRNPTNLSRKSPRREILVESHEIRGNPKLIGSGIGPLKRQKPWEGLATRSPSKLSAEQRRRPGHFYAHQLSHYSVPLALALML